MLASRADSFLSGSIEVYQQPDKPLFCGSHGPRSLSSCRNKQQEAGRARKNNACSGYAMLAYPLHAFFQLLCEFAGHQAGRGRPRYNEGDLTVSLATARLIEV